MNILIDSLPKTVTIGNDVYAIRSDFRISIMFELLMRDEDLADEQRLAQAINLYFPIVPDLSYLPEITKKMIWFYDCGAEPKDEKESEQEETDSDPEWFEQMPYSFEHDAEYIYAAFWEQYGIDLSEEVLHWWKFRALFKSLSENTKFVKIMGYRSINITSKLSKEQRAFYSRMKSIYALPIPKKEQERIDKITYALTHGGDLTGIV